MNQSKRGLYLLLSLFALFLVMFLLPESLLNASENIFTFITREGEGAKVTGQTVTLDWKGWLTIFIFFTVFFSLVKEYLPPDIIMLLGAGSLVVTGVISPKEFLGGFAQDVIVTLAMLFIIARCMEVNGILNLLAKRALPREKKSIRQLLTMMFPLSIASAFLNNTPIVLMLTPVITKWAIDHKFSPSKFLIPLSYATIMGGACTLIGTSSNLVVDGILRSVSPGNGLSFFELSYIGVPLVFAGFLYMIFIGHHLLPERQDPVTAVTKQTKEFTSEFFVQDNCPLANKTVREVSPKYFHGEYLVEIERGQLLIDSPSAEEVILPGDRLVFAGEIETIAELHAIEGLQSLQDPHFKLDPTSSHFAEVVISPTSTLIGKTLKRINFRKFYGASVLAIYRQGKRVMGKVNNIVIQAGDTLMLLSGDAWSHNVAYTQDFFYIRTHEKLPIFHTTKGIFIIIILVMMITAAAMGVPMLSATFCAACTFIVTKCITIREARLSIRWNLLVLIASAFSFGFALRSTGVATYLASGILAVVGDNPYLVVAGIFLTTMAVTEIITNNAAALLLLPIALQTATLAGYTSPESMKAVAVTVAIAASCSFITPIGYQTNTIVYGPGGYKFTDYIKIGAPLSFIFFLIATFLIPKIWVFH